MVTENKILINGKEFEVISYMTLDSGNFIVYTDEKKHNNGQILLYINRVSEINDEIVFDEVDEEEFSIIIEKLKERVVNNG